MSGRRAPSGARSLGTTQRWLIGGALGAALAVLASIAFWWISEDSSESDAVTDGEPELLVTGEPTDPDALWVFGFDTVRLDPDTLEVAGRLGEPAFGATHAAGDAVFLYEPGDGRFGVLDSSLNELTELSPLPRAPFEASQASMASTPDSLAVVTNADEVTLVSTAEPEDRAQVQVGTGDGRVWVASDGARLFVLHQAGGGAVSVAALAGDGGLGEAVHIGASDVAAIGELVGFVGDAKRLWVVGSRAVLPMDPDGLATDPVVAIPESAGAIHQAAAADGALWAVLGTGDAIARVDPSGEIVGVPVRDAEMPAYRPPSSIVAGRERVWVLVPALATPDRHDAVITEIDTGDLERTRHLMVGSELFAGAIAVT